MSRETYLAEARALIAQAQQAAADEQRALYQKHLARAQELVNKLAQSAARNGQRPNIEARVMPDTRMVLTMARPQTVLLVNYL